MPITYVERTSDPGTDCKNSTMTNKLNNEAINKIAYYRLDHPTAAGFNDWTQCFLSADGTSLPEGSVNTMCNASASNVETADSTYFRTCFNDKYEYNVNQNDITITSNIIFACKVNNDYYGVDFDKLNDASEQDKWNAFVSWARRSEYNGKQMTCGNLTTKASNLIPLANYNTELVNQEKNDGTLDKDGLRSFTQDTTKESSIFQKAGFIQSDGTIISQFQTKSIVGYGKL